uniref:Uncharacterized protein n=1 Tax=Glossina austeni TaxID=7395 RepID=A0A1A9UQB4_GLOAU
MCVFINYILITIDFPINTWFERISILVILLNCITLGMYQPCVDDACLEYRCKILQSTTVGVKSGSYDTDTVLPTLILLTRLYGSNVASANYSLCSLKEEEEGEPSTHCIVVF